MLFVCGEGLNHSQRVIFGAVQNDENFPAVRLLRKVAVNGIKRFGDALRFIEGRDDDA
jgi:hypothetical protein